MGPPGLAGAPGEAGREVNLSWIYWDRIYWDQIYCDRFYCDRIDSERIYCDRFYCDRFYCLPGVGSTLTRGRMCSL